MPTVDVEAPVVDSSPLDGPVDAIPSEETGSGGELEQYIADETSATTSFSEGEEEVTPVGVGDDSTRHIVEDEPMDDRRPLTPFDAVVPSHSQSRLPRNQARDEGRILTAHPDAIEVSPRCDRCELDDRRCLRRPVIQGKCFTCATGYCSFVQRSRRDVLVSPVATRPTPAPAQIVELFNVVKYAREVTGRPRDYLVGQARSLAREVGIDLNDIADDLNDVPEASGSGPGVRGV